MISTTLSYLQKKTKHTKQKFLNLLTLFIVQLLPLNRTLERLDPKWDDLLNTLPAKGADGQPVSLFTAEAQALDTAYAQFCIYLLYRHLPGALLDDDIPGRAAFCVLSTRVLMALCAGCPGCTLADCTEIARMYSAEIEYSEDNIAALLDALWEA